MRSGGLVSRMEGDRIVVNGFAAGGNPGVSAARGASNDHSLESLKLEHQLVRVPYEHLKKSLRTSTRMVEKEVNAVVAGVAVAVDKNLSKQEAVEQLTSLVSRLQGLKRKLDESNKLEHVQVQRCRARMDHLTMLRDGDKDCQKKWNELRVDRIIVDYLLRNCYYSTAQLLTESSNIQELCDADIFVDAHRVIESLRKKDCSEALAWCTENKSKLKKYKSKLEFKLRLQEFIELVRSERMMDAIIYARKFLSPWGSTNLKELQQAMATLAFKSSTDCAGYKAFFEDSQWDSLVEQFKQEFYKLYGMTNEPLLHLHMQAGLSALKTPFCYEESCTKEDPLSQENIRKLAEPLPYAKHIHSKLVCYITKELMDEDNPPLVLPNGYVYSKKALDEMIRAEGKITCPKTGYVCSMSEVHKAYIS
ncbi:protein MAEA homolog [Selaginella moellendorffii]|nr:protein MAEA homolog [Selaginella moellendorffii]|eukprot:XP_002968172.2 protein MAEA homolog [Selaginella moellendorffii]